MNLPEDLPEMRVLVLAPFGRDARLTTEVLHDAGIAGLVCDTLEQLCLELSRGAGAAIVAAEALDRARVPALAAALSEQPAWSDLPLVLAAPAHQARAARDWMLEALQPARHITLLERPIRVQTLVSVVRSALGTRRRQYEMRELIEQLRLSVERLDAEHAVRERFVDLLAHDLRGPLGASKLNAQLLAQRLHSPERIQSLAHAIQKSVDRADKMIRNLLDAHSLRAGQRLPLEPVKCDLVQIARDAIEDLSDAERARLVFSGPARLEGHWDPDLLLRSVWNLVTNALKYGFRHTPIELAVGADEAAAWLSVHNHGPGIAPEEQQQLFAPFTQSRRAGDGQQHGWGLGLSLVKGVAVAHGGSIDVQSDPAAGTRFLLRLPRQPQ